MRSNKRQETAHDEENINSIIEKINSKVPLYQMLGLNIDSKLEEFKKKYYKLAVKLHPDKVKDIKGGQEAFQILSGTYQDYYNYVTEKKDRTYRNFYREREMVADDSPEFGYDSYDTTSQRDQFFAWQYQLHEAPMPPSLQTIMNNIQQKAETYGNQFQFDSLMTFTKIQIKENDVVREIKVSATCKKIYEMAKDALEKNVDVKKTLTAILDVLAESKKSEESPTHTQQILSFFHIQKRSNNTKAIHAELKKTIERMFAYDEVRSEPSRSR